jgi:Tfp pilus assembly protein PilO
MRLIFSIILVIAAVAGFVLYVNPMWTEVRTLRTQSGEYQSVLANAKQLEVARDGLLKTYNQLSQTDRTRLATMLPTSPENVSLILEVNAAAERSGLLLQNVKVIDQDDRATRQRTAGLASLPSDVGLVQLEISVVGPYSAFTTFVRDIERNGRLIDFTKVSFVALDDKTSYQYTVGLRTYWLRQ